MNRILCTTHLLVHGRATQLVNKYNYVVEQRSDLVDGVIGATTWISVATSAALAFGSNDAWIIFPAAGLSIAAYYYSRHHINKQFNSLPFKSKSGKYKKLTLPELEVVISHLGEGKIELPDDEITSAAVKIVAASNLDIEER